MSELFSDAMIDAETLGTAAGCMVTQIGVCLFNRVGDPAMHAQLWNLALVPQQANGLRADVDTIMWWMRQSDDARRSWVDAATEMPSAVLSQLDVLIKSRCVPTVTMWANSPQFDFSILAPLWRMAKIPVPWRYTAEADFRTLRLVAPAVPRREPTLKHRADSDAEAQALYVRDVFAFLASRSAEQGKGS